MFILKDNNLIYNLKVHKRIPFLKHGYIRQVKSSHAKHGLINPSLKLYWFNSYTGPKEATT